MHACPLSLLPESLLPFSFLVGTETDGVERGSLLFLLRGKKMIPGEVMYFPKVTQLVGNRFFSCLSRPSGMRRKDMVLELPRPHVHVLPL